MKTSIDYLPEEKQRDLYQIVDLVREEVRDVEMIILFGSYARNKYVDYDQRVEFGIPTYFMSDYDILIVTSKAMWPDMPPSAEDRIQYRFSRGKKPAFHTSPEFIVEGIDRFNHAIDSGYYFYTDIRKEGIMLYDSGKYTLAPVRKLNFFEIAKLAEEYYDERFKWASSFLHHAQIAYDEKNYVMASFLLHQATENYLHTITLVFTLYQYKLHKLAKLMKHCKKHTLEIGKIFPQDTEEEKRLFNLLEDAYVQSRHNMYFRVSQEDIEALTPKVEQLRNLTKRISRERLDYYEKMKGN